MRAKKYDWMREAPKLLRRMKRGKFYTFSELFNLMYGKELDWMLKALLYEKAKTWFIASASYKLRAILVTLVMNGKLVTGARKEEEPIYAEFQGKQGVTSKGKRVPVLPEAYAIPRKRSVSR